MIVVWWHPARRDDQVAADVKLRKMIKKQVVRIIVYVNAIIIIEGTQ